MLDGIELLKRQSVDRAGCRVHAVVEIEVATSKQLAQQNLDVMPDLQRSQCIITYVDNNDVQPFEEQTVTVDMLIRGMPQENLYWGNSGCVCPTLEYDWSVRTASTWQRAESHHGVQR